MSSKSKSRKLMTLSQGDLVDCQYDIPKNITFVINKLTKIRDNALKKGYTKVMIELNDTYFEPVFNITGIKTIKGEK